MLAGPGSRFRVQRWEIPAGIEQPGYRFTMHAFRQKKRRPCPSLDGGRLCPCSPLAMEANAAVRSLRSTSLASSRGACQANHSSPCGEVDQCHLRQRPVVPSQTRQDCRSFVGRLVGDHHKAGQAGSIGKRGQQVRGWIFLPMMACRSTHVVWMATPSSVCRNSPVAEAPECETRSISR